ncbi:DUF898 family protein [Corynebacterium halotolerans]|uniref:DUF898 domain-containing protein n=1 Tax=Corynebacterium halotolerans YIM 70093 = DSM 44683 TaxID=1121362 RepID=M1P5V1_9CORY|nr:DUF898 family protein [Corynebacterium halotolerans]AGF72006.1 hypothetical protein A605_05000 [Corynebacterium halotolerans YIM 70093 = DSM 44683]
MSTPVNQPPHPDPAPFAAAGVPFATPVPPVAQVHPGQAHPGQALPVVRPVPGAAMYRFDGGAASWFGVQLLALLVTVCTLGICFPWAVVMVYRWQTKHTLLFGHRLRFTGSAWGLFGQWIKWWLLTVITLGIYNFWVYPRMTRWIVEHQCFAEPELALQ